MRALAALAALLLAAGVTPAAAHDLSTRIGGFWGGVVHPFLVPVQVMALVALGFVIAQQKRWGPAFAGFAAGVGAGIAVIVAAFELNDTDMLLLAITIMVGPLAILARPLPLIISAVLAFMVGAAIAFDSVPDDISMVRSFLALLGSGAGAALALAAIAALAATRQRPWERIGLRVIASWITAGAILVLTLRLVTELRTP